MIGDKRKFPVVLVVPNWEQLEKWAKQQQHHLDRPRAAARDADDQGEDGEGGARRSSTGLAQFETPKKIALLEHDFSIERGELTPTLKVKRRVVDKTYKAVIDALYVDEHEPAGRQLATPPDVEGEEGRAPPRRAPPPTPRRRAPAR